MNITTVNGSYELGLHGLYVSFSNAITELELLKLDVHLDIIYSLGECCQEDKIRRKIEAQKNILLQ